MAFFVALPWAASAPLHGFWHQVSAQTRMEATGPTALKISYSIACGLFSGRCMCHLEGSLLQKERTQNETKNSTTGFDTHPHTCVILIMGHLELGKPACWMVLKGKRPPGFDTYLCCGIPVQTAHSRMLYMGHQRAAERKYTERMLFVACNLELRPVKEELKATLSNKTNQPFGDHHASHSFILMSVQGGNTPCAFVTAS